MRITTGIKAISLWVLVFQSHCIHLRAADEDRRVLAGAHVDNEVPHEPLLGSIQQAPVNESLHHVEAPQQVPLPPEAFGAAAWKEYFSVEVNEEPPLPDDIEDILNAEAPFLLEGETERQRVRDNHLLVLIPAKVSYTKRTTFLFFS